MQRFFLNNQLLAKNETQIEELLNNRYPQIGLDLDGPWRKTILHNAKNKPQTLKMVRLMGEGNPSLSEWKVSGPGCRRSGSLPACVPRTLSILLRGGTWDESAVSRGRGQYRQDSRLGQSMRR